MKKLLLVSFVFFTHYCFSQNEVKLSPEGIKPIVVEAEGKTAEELYKKTINWVNTAYKNPDKVIKAKIENEMLRIEGYCDNCWELKTLGMSNFYDMTYTIEFEFKDNKYRYTISSVQLSDNGTQFMYTYTSFYNKKGEVRGMYEKSVVSMESSLQSTFTSSKDYITGNSALKKQDW